MGTRATRLERRRAERASFRTGVGTVASRVTGLLRLVVAAYAVGGAGVGDAYNLANNTPNIIHDLVLGGVLAASFVPVFVERIATRSRREALDSISAVVTLSVVVLVVSTALLVLLAPEVIDLYTVGSGTGALHQAEHPLAVELLRFFAPQLLAYGVISLIAAVLATQDRFVAVGVVPIVNNLVGIGVLGAFAALAHLPRVITPSVVSHLSSHLVLLLGLGTTTGVVLQAVALLPSLRRAGVHLHLTWRPHDPAVTMILRLSGWTMGFVAANQLSVFIIQALEYHLNRVSVYSYAYQFFLFPYAVVAISVVNVATPALARAHVLQDGQEVGRRFGIAVRQVLSLVLPAAVGYLVLAKPIITLVLGHGEFDNPTDINQTAASLALFALGLPSFCIYFLAIRTFQAMRDARTAFICYALENGTNILAAFLLYRPLGVRGLALSYSIAYTVGAIAALAILRERLGTIGGHAILTSSVRIVALSALMAVTIAFVAAVIGTSAGLIGWIRLVVIVAAGTIAYLGGAGIAASLHGWQTSRRNRR